MTTNKIVSIGTLPDWFRKEFESDFKVIIVEDSARNDLLANLDPQVVAIIARGSVMIDPEVMDLAPALKCVARTGVGYDTVDIEAASARSLPVIFTPGAMSSAVAEHTMALLYGAAKRLQGWRDALRRGDWEERYEEFSLDVSGGTLGIIGFGRIGRQVRRIVKTLDLDILVNDPYLDPDDFRDQEVEFVDKKTLYKESDFITLHVPLNPETTGLIDRSALEGMKRGAILINTSRGGVVASLDLLYEALEEFRLKAVGLDVFPEEPPGDHPIFQHPRAIVTGHVAARTPGAQANILNTVRVELKAILEGQTPNPVNIVNPQVLRSMKN